MDTELKTERFQLMVEPSVMQLIDNFRFDRRIGSRSEAARRLLMSGLQTETAEGSESGNPAPAAVET